MARPTTLALRALRPAPVVRRQHRLFSFSVPRHNEKPPSFKSQLYESTQQRLKRERAEQERFARYQTQSPGGRYAAMLFSMRASPKILRPY